MLSELEKTHTRRFLGYPVAGVDRSGAAGGPFQSSGGPLEYRINTLSTAEETVLRSYLGTLGDLEQAIPDTGAGLDTGSAAGWTRNPGELNDRMRLFDDWRRRLCAFLGVPPGAALAREKTVPMVV